MITLPALRRNITPKHRGSLFYFSFFLSMGSFSPFLNVYYKDLGFSGQQIGILSVFFPVVSLILAPPLSALADKKNWRIQILQAAIIGGAVFIFMLGLPHSFKFVAVTLLLLAVVFSPLMSVADSLMVNLAQQRDLNYGGMRLWGSIGFALSAIIFGFVFQCYSLSPMFTIASLLMIPLFVIASTLEEVPSVENQDTQPISILFREMGLMILILVSFLMGISNSLTLSFEGILVRFLGGSNFLVGLTVGVAGISEIITMRYGQKIADRIRKTNALIVSIGLLGVAYIVYMIAGSPWMLLPAALLRGLGFGLFFTTIVWMVNERAPEEWVTTAQSFRTVAMFSVAPLLAGPLGGLVHDQVSPSAVFGIGVVSLSMAGVILGVATSKRILE